MGDGLAANAWVHWSVSQLNSVKTKSPTDHCHEPILQWRLDIVPDLQNSTSVQHSGVNAYNELLYLGTSHRSGVLLVDHRYGVRVGRLETTSAPVQATPTIIDYEWATPTLLSIYQAWCMHGSLPTPSQQLMESSHASPKSDRSTEHDHKPLVHCARYSCEYTH